MPNGAFPRVRKFIDAPGQARSDWEIICALPRARLPVLINPAVKPGKLFTTFHTAEVFLNNLTSPYRNRYVLAREYKVTAVRSEKV